MKIDMHSYFYISSKKIQKNKFRYKLTIMEADRDERDQKIEEKVQPRKKLDIVVVSDTHGSYTHLNKILSMKGDIFIHAGDFTDYGIQEDFTMFFKYLDKLVNFRYKIVIAGNHEISMDNGCVTQKKKEIYLKKYPCLLTREQILQEIKKRAIYLEHESIEIEGVKIFGSPYTPYFVGNAFQYRHWNEKVIWDAIPPKIDLLVTHCPPFGILDMNSEKKHSGSQLLKDKVFEIKPRYHVFGHIHESMGMYKMEGVTFINVATSPTRILI